MRESIGAAWLMIIFMTFIVLFSGYLAFSINYSKSFRVKDGIVERIQKHNGIKLYGDSIYSSSGNTLREIDNFLAEISYNARGDCVRFAEAEADTDRYQLAGVNGTAYKVGPARGETYNYCLMKISSSNSPSLAINAAYYKVIVFFSLQIGNISLFSNFHTTGVTQTLYYPKDDLFGYS